MATIPRRVRFWADWSQGEKVLITLFAVIAVFVAAQTVYFVLDDRERDRREAAFVRDSIKKDKEQDECLSRQIQATRTYLSVRGEIAERDRASVNAVIDSFADAARRMDGDNTEILKALRKFEKVQRQVIRDRNNEQLPDFPPGRCVTHPNGKGSGGTGDTGESPAPEPTAPTPDRTEDDGATTGSGSEKKRKGRRAPDRTPDPDDKPSPPRTPRQPPLVQLPPVPDVIPLPDIALDLPGVATVTTEVDGSP